MSFRMIVFFVMILRPTRSTRTATLFPYTTLVRTRRSTRTSDRSGYGRPLARLIWHGLLSSPQRPQSVAPSHPRQEGRPLQMLCRLQSGSRLVRAPQIGRATCRERVCRYVYISVCAVSVTQNIYYISEIYRVA